MSVVRSVIAACAAGTSGDVCGAARRGPRRRANRCHIRHRLLPGRSLLGALDFGADLAAKHYNVNLDYQQGENDPVRINNIVETAIANDVDGIVWGITVEGAYTEVIQKARDAGIAVIISNEDEPLGAKATARQAYVGQDFVSAGYRIGRYMVKQHNLGEGDFCVTPVEESDLIYAQKRYEGTKMGLDESGVGSELLHTGGVMETSLNIIAEYLLGHPEVTCIIGLGHVPTTVIPRAMKRRASRASRSAVSTSVPRSWRTQGWDHHGYHEPAGFLAGLHARTVHSHVGALRAGAGGLRHRRRNDHPGQCRQDLEGGRHVSVSLARP